MNEWLSNETIDILNEIDTYRKVHNKFKDEKIKPLTDSDIKELPLLPKTWSWVTSNDISTFITNGVHSPTSMDDVLGINKKMGEFKQTTQKSHRILTNPLFCKG